MKSKLPVFIPPSAYTPFLRRFTDERAADIAEIKALYSTVTARFNASVWANPDIIERVNSAIAEQVTELVTLPPVPVAEAMDRCQIAILSLEKTLFKTPVINDWAVLSLKEQVDLRRFLRAQEHFLANENRVFELLSTTLTNVFAGLASMLPQLSGAASQFTVPLYTLIDANDVVDRIIGTLSSAALADAGLFADLNDQIYRNICVASKIVPYEEHKRPFITAADSELPAVQLIETYLKGTPLLDLMHTRVPFVIPRKAYRAHGAIFAPTDHGKTQTLQSIIVSFLKEDDPPAMFIIDSMGAMLKKIERLEVFAGRLNDRLVVLDPHDAQPPALNFFKLQGGTDAQQMSLFFYLFKAIEQGLTPRQATMVAYLVRLMQEIGGTLETLREVCEAKQPKYEDGIARLDPIARSFFQNQFYGKDQLVNQTKQQIAARLYTVGYNPMFNRMFSAAENKFNAFDCIQQKNIVLINTDRLFLGDEGSVIFGRFIIAQCLAAALARAPIPEEDRHLALLVVDEAKSYLDDQAEKILSDARQFGLGMLMATQAPHQLPEGVQRELASNTSIKMVGPVAYSVASQLARDMHTTPEFIQSMRSYDRSHTEFACHVRTDNLTPSAVKLTIPMGILEKEPRMSDTQHAAMRAANRARYGAPPAPPIPASVQTVTISPKKNEVKKAEQKVSAPKKDEPPRTDTTPTDLDTDH